ncbi:UvrD-helicase domain-containing protein [Thiohalorhabdus denitrificans]|uniref:DNA 3'-5' helicase n=1 Tax=Thiohalorhabdus denitrificans TaxID=381306 RepID=A0A1G5E8M9_9GAMM|nr:UvrD-helicase domain-containing protein [Thiohalorhabdus denitrificans]SCY23267.1 ATP-dependent DNA helicase UvrD [Thiohalorhabdus denitrificans]
MLEGLNEQQQEAVALPAGPNLILAGAGSGKTRVLTHRIAHLVGHLGEPPGSILAVTFTNKAAREMRERVEELLGISVANLWIGTFHGLCHRILRAHAAALELPSDFQILDAEDQKRMVRRVIREAGVDEKAYDPRRVQGAVNACKEDGLTPAEVASRGDDDPTIPALYRRYQATLHQAGLVDFGDLLLRTLELFRKQPEVAAHYRERFRHVLVDEFQDTNRIQLLWLQALVGEGDDFFAVGDDDQSIYGWRGARVDHVLNFRDHYPDCNVVRLERNYRSTQPILTAANDVIRRNTGRLGKELWTEQEEGQPVGWLAAPTEREEAQFVVSEIRRWVEGGRARAECAVLYRSHAQSRQIEEALLGAGLPYRVYGGMRFYERAEIKDALAYLRLLRNRDDDASFDRVVNQPARGVGEKSLAAVREAASGGSLWQGAENALASGAVRGKARTGLEAFMRLIDDLTAASRNLELGDLVERVLRDTGLAEAWAAKGDGDADNRIENLEELMSAAEQFAAEEVPDDEDPLSAFLAHTALEAGEGRADPDEDAVQLMSLHAAKGLEFPRVFLTGMEEGLFPHFRTLDDEAALEEERRLCYVGMTRAMEELTLTMARRRRLYGRDQTNPPSRFSEEISPERLNDLTPRPAVDGPGLGGMAGPGAAPQPAEGREPPPYPPGSGVRHPRFGAGVVMACEGSGPKARVRVFFRDLGEEKWLITEYAGLERLE